MNETTRWLDRVRGNDSIREVARKIGTTHATLNRQARDDQIAFELAREISRTYGRPILADLVALGFLTADDIGVDSVESALSAATDEQLVFEVGKRLGVTNASQLFDAPLGEAIESASKIVRLPRGVGGPTEDQEAAAAKTKGRDRGTTPEET